MTALHQSSGIGSQCGRRHRLGDAPLADRRGSLLHSLVVVVAHLCHDDPRRCCCPDRPQRDIGGRRRQPPRKGCRGEELGGCG